MLDIPDNTIYIKNKWELELNIMIKDGDWEKYVWDATWVLIVTCGRSSIRR